VELDRAIATHYDRHAEDYAQLDQALENVASRVNSPPGARLLDVGCGPGNLTFSLHDAWCFEQVTGVDISAEAVRLAEARAQELDFANFRFLQANACHLPFDDEIFDVVVSNNMLHLIRDQKRALSEMLRVLRPGNHGVLQFPGGDIVAPEMIQLLDEAWRQALPQTQPPTLYQNITTELLKTYLTDLGVEQFEIDWSRSVRRLPESAVEEWLHFFRIVGGFWNFGLADSVSRQVDSILTDLVRNEVTQKGHFTDTCNELVVEFVKP
jgi:ubiquinone/menaquinone biosynthesis C-methylase UbiE